MPKSKNQSIKLRLQKLIADCGITSRRKAEELILQGRVKVNNELITELGVKVDPINDIVEVDDNVIDLMAVQKIYIVLNKPRGYVTTLSDPEGRKTVMDLCKGIDARIFPVGRLDYLSEGLLILTNDGELANMIMHPSFEVEKIYEVKVFGKVTEGIIKKLKKGVQVKEEFYKPNMVRVIEELPNKTWLEFRLNEGKNREIRKICEAFELTIDKLRRVAIEGLSISGISPGNFIILSKNELLNFLNISEDGKKKYKKFAYKSKKKTIKVKGQKSSPTQELVKADDQKFEKYKKKNYNKTMSIYKERNKAKPETPSED